MWTEHPPHARRLGEGCQAEWPRCAATPGLARITLAWGWWLG